MMECVHKHTYMCKETWVQLDKKHWYEHVPKSVETSLEGKVTILRNQQVQYTLTELSPTTKQIL